MWVIKLGGSLARSTELTHWLSAIAGCAGEKLLLVPGGGAFADLVREFSVSHSLSDSCSHRMAIRAMEQYGLLLLDLAPCLRAVSRCEELDAVFNAGRIPLFMPDQLLLESPEIPASWAVTSDSIGAWLAAETGATDLLLVKSLQPEMQASPVQSLIEAGIVDSAFADYMTTGMRYWWCAANSHRDLLAILQRQASPGVSRILP